MSNVYKNIKAIRNKKQLSQQDVAKMLGTNQSNYTRIESGLTQLTIERMEQLARIFEMSVNEILNYEGGNVENSEVSGYIKMIKSLEKKLKESQEEVKVSENDYSDYSAEKEKLSTEIKSLKAIIKEKDERLKEKDERIKDKDVVIETLKMFIKSKE